MPHPEVGGGRRGRQASARECAGSMCRVCPRHQCDQAGTFWLGATPCTIPGIVRAWSLWVSAHGRKTSGAAARECGQERLHFLGCGLSAKLELAVSFVHYRPQMATGAGGGWLNSRRRRRAASAAWLAAVTTAGLAQGRKGSRLNIQHFDTGSGE